MAANYYSLIFRAVSKLPSNTPKARREIYERARKALAAQTDAKLEHNALERAIRAVEKSPHEIPGTRGPTSLLLLSIFFLGNLWLLDSTCMSVYWVVRPWNKKLMAGEVGATEMSAKIKLDDRFKDSGTLESNEKIEPFFATNVNGKRLALSIGIAGAILTPLYTGSLVEFVRHPIVPAGVSYTTEDDPRNTPEADEASMKCALNSMFSGSKLNPKTNRPNTEACDKSIGLPWFPPVEVAHPYPEKPDFGLAALLARDVLLGSIIPVFLILVVPRIGRRYWRWLTS